MSDKQIYDRNMEFLRRVPMEEFIEHLVRALRSEIQELRKEENETMATVDATQQAIIRFQAAVDARETAEQSAIADLEAHVVPDSLVQSINDAAAKIEAQNSQAQNAAAATPGAGTATGGATAATGAADGATGAADGATGAAQGDGTGAAA